MELADHAGVVLAQSASAVGKDSDDDQLLVVCDRSEPGHSGADKGDGVRVGSVGLASLTGGEHPRPGGQLRRDVDHLFTASQEAGGDVPADALAPFDGPCPLGPLMHVPGHRFEAVAVGGEPACAQDGFVGTHHLDRGGALCGSMPMTTGPDGLLI